MLVDSELGRGSCFTLYLPSAPADQDAADESDLPERVTLPGLSVLMVEDNPSIGASTEAMLEQMDFEVRWVTTAQQALSELAGNPEQFHVVFTDITMPGMSGIELHARIEALYPWLPVVLTTGYSSDVGPQPAGQSQRFELLQKPYSIEQLATVLHKVASRQSEASDA